MDLIEHGNQYSEPSGSSKQYTFKCSNCGCKWTMYKDEVVEMSFKIKIRKKGKAKESKEGRKLKCPECLQPTAVRIK